MVYIFKKIKNTLTKENIMSNYFKIIPKKKIISLNYRKIYNCNSTKYAKNIIMIEYVASQLTNILK